MNISQLEAFVMAIEAGSLNKAATKLNRVQSSVSLRIKQLEDRLGVPVLRRLSNGVEPTPAGKVLYRYAEKILDLSKEARRAIQQISDTGEVRIGLIEIIPVPCIDRIISYADSQNITISIKIGTSDALIKMLKQSDVDFAIVCDGLAEENWPTLPLYAETLHLISSKVERNLESMSDLRGKKFYVHSKKSASMRNLNILLSGIDDRRKSIVECGSYKVLFSTLEKSEGFSLVPASVLQDHVSIGSAVKVHDVYGEFSQISIELAYTNERASRSVILMREAITKILHKNWHYDIDNGHTIPRSQGNARDDDKGGVANHGSV